MKDMGETTRPIDKIDREAGVNFRGYLVRENVARLKWLLGEGVELDPVTVVQVSSTHYILVDGYHRAHIAEQAGVEKIRARVYEGTLAEAKLAALAANAEHVGLPRGSGDVKRAIIYAKRDHDLRDLSNKELAVAIGCTERYVRMCAPEGRATIGLEGEERKRRLASVQRKKEREKEQRQEAKEKKKDRELWSRYMAGQTKMVDMRKAVLAVLEELRRSQARPFARALPYAQLKVHLEGAARLIEQATPHRFCVPCEDCEGSGFLTVAEAHEQGEQS